MGGPQMYATMNMGMAGVMNMGMGPMGIPGQLPNGMQQPAVKRDFPNLFTLYAGNLSDKTFDLDLLKYFQSRGYKLASAKVMFDRDTKRSKGFGYLNFFALDEALRCLEE